MKRLQVFTIKLSKLFTQYEVSRRKILFNKICSNDNKILSKYYKNDYKTKLLNFQGMIKRF